MRAFCRYLYEQKLINKNIDYVIGRNRYIVKEKLPSTYTCEEVLQIESSVNQSTPVGKRDYAMLLLATRLGLRSSDIAGLQFSNLDWDRNIIRLIQYKTKREIIATLKGCRRSYHQLCEIWQTEFFFQTDIPILFSPI